MSKLRVFIASSKESLHIAEIIIAKLQEHFYVFPWYHDDIFKLNQTPIESLEHLKSGFDSMVVVSIYEDKLIKRGKEYNSIRDNLIFEHALGIGYYGRENSVLVIPNNIQDTTNPTDLAGMTHLLFNETSHGFDSLNNVSDRLIKHLTDSNSIIYPKKGMFGINLLSEETVEITLGKYSFNALVPTSKRLKIHFRPDPNIRWNMSMEHISQFIMGDFIDNSRILSNKPNESKECDAEFNITEGTGFISIDYYSDDEILTTKQIKVS